MDALPVSLLNRLTSEEDSAYSTLSTDTIPISVEAIRRISTRKILAYTPQAIDTLHSNLDSQDPGIQIKAASKLLDLSPAVQSADSPSSQADSIPSSAFTALMSGLGTFFQSAGLLPPTQSAPDQTTTIVPHPMQEDPPVSAPALTPLGTIQARRRSTTDPTSFDPPEVH